MGDPIIEVIIQTGVCACGTLQDSLGVYNGEKRDNLLAPKRSIGEVTQVYWVFGKGLREPEDVVGVTMLCGSSQTYLT